MTTSRVDLRLRYGSQIFYLSGFPLVPNLADGEGTGVSRTALTGWTPNRADSTVDQPERLTDLVRVPESFSLEIIDSPSAIVQFMNRIEEALAQGERAYKRRSGAVPYLEVRLGSSSTIWYRTPALGGGFLYDDAFFRGLTAGVAPITLRVDRAYFWEGRERDISLTNRNGTSATGLTLWNNSYPPTNGRDNWATVDTVLGALPTPPYVRIADNTGGPDRILNVWLNGSHLTPTLTGASIQATDATFGGSNAPSGSNPSTSGTIRRVTVSSTNTDQLLMDFDLSSDLMSRFRGTLTDVQGFFSSIVPDSVYVRAEVSYNGGVVSLWQGDYVRGSSTTRLIEFGATRLPPYLAGSDNLTGLTLTIYGRLRPGESPVVLDLDQINLMPRTSFRRYRAAAFGIPQSYFLYDDAPDDALYWATINREDRAAFYTGAGQLYLYPGYTNRLYVVHDVSSSVGFSPLRAIQLRVSYRPRYPTLA